jgi:hypothetical protein
MIENSYVEIASDGKRVTVNYFEDDKVLEGPAILPARYASFAAMCQYIETQFNHHRLNTHQLSKLQGLLGSPWPHTHFRIYWKDANGGTVNEAGNYPSGSAENLGEGLAVLVPDVPKTK